MRKVEMTNEVIDKILQSLCEEGGCTHTEKSSIVLGFIGGRSAMISWRREFNYISITPVMIAACAKAWSEKDLDEYYRDFMTDVEKRLPKEYIFKKEQIIEGSCIIYNVFTNEEERG
jgi:hypothetical protein